MEKFLKDLKLLYFLMLFVPVVLLVVFSLIIAEGTIMQNEQIDAVAKYLVPLFALIFIPFGVIRFKKSLKEIELEETVGEKLLIYKRAFVTRIAILEGISIFAVVEYMLTLNQLYIVYALISLALFIPFFPTFSRIKKDLKLNLSYAEKDRIEMNKSKSYASRNPWIFLPLIIFMILLNYNSLKELFQNKVILPEVQIDNGVLNDSIYNNEFLGWTFILPQGFKETPVEIIERSNNLGNELFDNESRPEDQEIRLLCVNSDYVDFRSSITYKGLYPNLENEKEYAETIERELLNASIDSVFIKKKNETIILIDSVEFRLSEYIMSGKVNRGIILMSHFFDEYIITLSFSYSSTEQGIEFLNKLKASKFEKI